MITRCCSLALGCLAGTVLATTAQAAVIAISGAGTAQSFYPGFVNAFDAQANVTDPPTDGSAGGSHISGGYNTGPRTGYVDFGEDFADIRITETWTQYRTFSGNANNPHLQYSEIWWDDDFDAMGPSDGDTSTVLVTDPTFNFYHADVPHVNSEIWLQNYGGADVTPQYRYLLMRMTPDANNIMSDRGREFAFIGYIVPEPASLALLGTGGLLMIRRRYV